MEIVFFKNNIYYYNLNLIINQAKQLHTIITTNIVVKYRHKLPHNVSLTIN